MLNTNTVKILFRATSYNGWPQIRICLDELDLADHCFDSESWSFEFDLDVAPKQRILQIQRYGKTANMWSQEQDQTVEIIDIQVDGIQIPAYVLDRNSSFQFDNQTHIGSRYFGPNGIWTWTLATPLITHVLDQKITHEAQYSQDYQYPWSYKLGPNSVNNLLSNIDLAMDRIQKL